MYNEVLYYRIKNVDFDGKSAHSSIVSVEIPHSQEKESYPVLVYPNPTIQGNSIKIKNIGYNTMLNTKLISVTGTQLNFEFQEINNNEFEVQTTSIPEGLCKLIFQSSKKVEYRTIQIVK